MKKIANNITLGIGGLVLRPIVKPAHTKQAIIMRRSPKLKLIFNVNYSTNLLCMKLHAERSDGIN